MDWLPENEIQSDALGDLQTRANKLSVFRIETEDDTERVAIALAANRDNLANLDYAIFEDTTLVPAGISILQQEGETPDPEANKLHYDLTNLTVRELGLLAQAVAAGEHSRKLPKDVKAGLQRGIQSGDLDQGRLKPQLLQKIQ